MGNIESQERDLYAQMLKTMLKARGCSIKHSQILDFLSFLNETCPWFPEGGTVNLLTWKKVGKQLHDRHRRRSRKMSYSYIRTMVLIPDCLDLEQESLRMSKQGEATALKHTVEGC